MSNEQVKQWVAALRSDEYKQGFGALHEGDGFCCLGVACDVAIKLVPDSGFWRLAIKPPLCRYEFSDQSGDHTTGQLTQDIEDFFGLDDPEGYLPWADRDGDIPSLIDLNDSRQFSFQQIADVINYVWGNDK